MTSKTHMLEVWCSHWQYWIVAVLFHYYDKVPEKATLANIYFGSCLIHHLGERMVTKNGSNCGSRNCHIASTVRNDCWYPAHFLLLQFLFHLPFPPRYSKGWCHSYSEWSSFLSSISLETSLQIHLKVWLLGHSKSYQVDHNPYPAFKKQPSRSLDQQKCTLDRDSGALGSFSSLSFPGHGVSGFALLCMYFSSLVIGPKQWTKQSWARTSKPWNKTFLFTKVHYLKHWFSAFLVQLLIQLLVL